MTCHDARARMSDWLDDALSPPERAETGAHLEGCPDCRREFERLEATVSLLARVQRPRAPAGFVDRVLAQLHPVPWYRRLGRRLFLPLRIKLPVEAAAMLLVAVLGVYLLHRTPELQDAARPELEAPASRAEPSPSQAPRQDTPKAGRAASAKLSEPAPGTSRESGNAAGGVQHLDSDQAAPSAPHDVKQEPQKEAAADRLQKLPALSPQAPPAPQPGSPAAVPPAVPRVESRDVPDQRPAERSESVARQAPAVSAKPQATIPGALGRLNVKDRQAAEKELIDLLTSVGGIESGRRQEPDATVIEVVVPGTRYADFVRGLTMLGTWSLEGQPAPLPADPPQLRLGIRISE